MSSIKLDINQLLKDTNLTQEALDTIVEKCLRKSCEEIVARAKQYEYYRDKLLSFKERTVAQ